MMYPLHSMLYMSKLGHCMERSLPGVWGSQNAVPYYFLLTPATEN